MVYFTPILGNLTNIVKLVLSTIYFDHYHFVHPSLDYIHAIIHMLAGDMWTGFYEFEQAGYSTTPGIFFDEIFSSDEVKEVGSTY